MDGYSSQTVQRNIKGKYGVAGKNHQHDDDGDQIECSGKSCRTCTGGLIADCIAVCCCPCAVAVNILALAFLKIPWMVGRKCLRMVKKKKLQEKRKDDKSHYCYSTDRVDSVEEVGTLGIVTSSFGKEELKESFNARIDAEEVWLDLYQVGHMGFGRVSFTGINSS